MITLQTGAIFFTTIFSLCFTPAPDNVYIFLQSCLQGRMAGMAVVLGICSALSAQVVAMVYGITTIVQTSTVLFTCLKVVGTLYLIFLAWQAFSQPLNVAEESPHRLGWGALYRRGIMINVSNPITPLFLLAFFPPFVHESQGPAFPQLLQLGVLLVISVFTAFSVISLVAHVLGSQFIQSKRVQRCLQYGSGVVLAGFAVFAAVATPM